MKDGIVRFPSCKVKDTSELLNPDGQTINQDALAAALHCDCVELSSEDNEVIELFAVDFLALMNTWLHAGAETTNCPVIDEDENYKPRTRLEKNFNKKKVAIAAIKIKYKRPTRTIYCSVDYADPRRVIGKGELFAKDIAIMLCQVVMMLSDKIKRDGESVSIELDSPKEGLIEEAKIDLEERRLRDKRAQCQYLHNDMCSPSQFDCPLYCNGRCSKL